MKVLLVNGSPNEKLSLIHISSTPGVRTVDIPTSSGDEEPYFYVEDAVGLVSEAQMDTLEFHLWGSRVDTLCLLYTSWTRTRRR